MAITWGLMSAAATGAKGKYLEPNIELSFRNFAAQLAARVAAFVTIKGPDIPKRQT